MYNSFLPELSVLIMLLALSYHRVSSMLPGNGGNVYAFILSTSLYYLQGYIDEAYLRERPREIYNTKRKQAVDF